MPKNQPKQVEEEQDYVILRVPAEAWSLLEETLTMDAKSTAFDRSLREKIGDALEQVKVIAPSLHPFLGHVIQTVRWLTEEEASAEDWRLPSSGCPVLELDNGCQVFPSKDSEGNEAGYLYGKMSDGQQIYVIPAE